MTSNTSHQKTIESEQKENYQMNETIVSLYHSHGASMQCENIQSIGTCSKTSHRKYRFNCLQITTSNLSLTHTHKHTYNHHNQQFNNMRTTKPKLKKKNDVKSAFCC